jgi:hypothetical protein
MSDTEIEQEVTPEPVEAAEVPEETSEEADPKDDELPDWAKDKIRKANNEAKNLRQRLKEQEPLVTAAQEAERAKMSELDRERAEKEDLKAQLSQRDTALLVERYRIPDEYLEFIGEGTFEEKEARAAKVGQMVQPKNDTTERPPSERPVSSLKPGASPSTPPVEDHSYPAAWGFKPPAET